MLLVTITLHCLYIIHYKYIYLSLYQHIYPIYIFMKITSPLILRMKVFMGFNPVLGLYLSFFHFIMIKLQWFGLYIMITNFFNVIQYNILSWYITYLNLISYIFFWNFKCSHQSNLRIPIFSTSFFINLFIILTIHSF